MDGLIHIWNNAFGNYLVPMWGAILGILTYLVAPTAAFYALWIAVFMDLITRVIAQSSKHGGFFQAIKQQQISSKKMFKGSAIKVVAYFFMTVLAHQSKYVVEIEAIPIIFSSIIYCILFLVEVLSIVENLIDAGAEDLKPLLLRFRKEKEKAVNAAGDALSDIANQGSTSPQPSDISAATETEQNSEKPPDIAPEP